MVVGLPLTLRGEHGEQAAETERFVDALRDAIDVPVESFDERFTTDLAEQGGGRKPSDRRPRGRASPVELPDVVEQRVPLSPREPPAGGRGPRGGNWRAAGARARPARRRRSASPSGS